jgi:hypothetical protein
MSERSLAIGTRGSPLALWQASWVAEQLARAGVKCRVVTIATRGDIEADAPVESIGPFGVFTKELQKALLDGRIDLAVHSLKDLPTEPIKGTVLAAVPPRESPRDALFQRVEKPSNNCHQARASQPAACGVKASCCTYGPISRWSPCAAMWTRACRNCAMGSSMRWCWPKRG